MGVLHIRDTSTNKFIPITSINGLTPHIGENGNWWVGNVDTETSASGAGGGVADSVAWGNVTGKPDTYPPAAHTHSEYLGKTETAANANQLNGKDAAYYIGARNLLDNSNFEIAQAGYNAAHGNEFYLCDRWITSVQSGTKLNNGVLFANNGGIVYQRVSGVAGKTVTFAMKTNGTGEQHMSVYTADLGNMIQQIWGYKNSDGIVCGTATIPSDIDVAAFILYPENGSIIEWVVLYEGEYTAETLPPYMPKGYVAELMECQRYFLTCGSVPFFRYAGGAGTEYFAGGMRFPVPMRIVPSVVAYSDVTNVGFVTPSTITYDNLSITAFGYDSASPIPQGTRAYMEFVASADL